jgi:hypothetical protein
MTPTRETVCAALLAQFKAHPGDFVTIGRRHIPAPKLGTVLQPAIFIASTMEETKQGMRGVPGKTVMEASLIVYCQGPGIDETPGAETSLAETTLNALLENIDAALAPDVNGVQTLGGIVQHCWVEGQVFKDPGILGNQAMAIVPVRILVP